MEDLDKSYYEQYWRTIVYIIIDCWRRAVDGHSDLYHKCLIGVYNKVNCRYIPQDWTFAIEPAVSSCSRIERSVDIQCVIKNYIDGFVFPISHRLADIW